MTSYPLNTVWSFFVAKVAQLSVKTRSFPSLSHGRFDFSYLIINNTFIICSRGSQVKGTVWYNRRITGKKSGLRCSVHPLTCCLPQRVESAVTIRFVHTLSSKLSGQGRTSTIHTSHCFITLVKNNEFYAIQQFRSLHLFHQFCIQLTKAFILALLLQCNKVLIDAMICYIMKYWAIATEI